MANRLMAIVLAAAAVGLGAGVYRLSAQQPAARPGGALYVATFVDVIPTNTAAATMAIERYVADSRKEGGNVRAEGMAQDGRANHLFIFEVWRDQAALDAHEASMTTRDFRTKLQPMLGAPFDQRVHHPLP